MNRPKKFQPAAFDTKFNAQNAADKIVIESGVPIPEGNRYGQWTLVAAKMNVGNSVFFLDADLKKATQKSLGLKNALNKAGKACISRTMDGGIRVWCTKSPKNNSETPSKVPNHDATNEKTP